MHGGGECVSLLIPPGARPQPAVLAGQQSQHNERDSVKWYEIVVPQRTALHPHCQATSRLNVAKTSPRYQPVHLCVV
jgi:hypothetical protein